MLAVADNVGDNQARGSVHPDVDRYKPDPTDPSIGDALSVERVWNGQ